MRMADSLEIGDVVLNFTTNAMPTNWTTDAVPHPEPHYSIATGFVCVIAASFIFGSNLLPVKKYEMGDGSIHLVLLLEYYCTSMATF